MGENGSEVLFCNAPECPTKQDNKNCGNCLICRLPFHYSCVGIKNKCNFVCTLCATAVTCIKRLNDTAEEVEKTQKLKYDDLKNDFDRMKKECGDMRKQLIKLEKQVSDLKAQMNVKTQNKPQNDANPPPAKSNLVLSDSILRDVDHNKLDDTTMIVMPGAKIAALHNRLKDYHGSSFNSVTFHVATNDLEGIKDDQDKLQDVVNEYSELIDDSKAISETVVVSSICPRLDEINDLVQPFNEALKSICDECPKVSFIDNTPSFTLGDGKINDGYIWKNGPHLTRPGVNCLARNLKLKLRQGERDVTRTHQYTQRSGADRPVNDSNIRIHRDGCRNCNERGHNVSTCRHSRPVICNVCKCRGHKAKHHRHPH